MPSPHPNLVPGTRIGLYEVERLISRGGFGAVYRVTRDGRAFALKLSLACGTELSSQERRVLEQRIAREVVSLMTIQHPAWCASTRSTAPTSSLA